ncbi:MAG: LVIVD repeat-containing protein, partial [Blastocatellia bacterium]
YKKHKEKNHEELKEVYEHHGEVLSIQVRGEYAYVAGGKDGLRVYDISNIDNKGYSERIVTAPVSPIGQRLHVKTKYAASVASPATIAVDPTRKHRPENEEAEYRDDKQPIHSLYAYLYVADKEEGLILVSAATLLDGNPSNNFMKRALTWNPESKLKGASFISINGTHAYITTDHGLVIVNINDPLKPRIVGDIPFKHAHSVQIQFRYAFVTDEEGMHVVDVTMPEQAKKIEGASVKIEHAHHLYLARTYAYVAAGKSGLVIVDIEKPEKPKIDQTFTADGKINDAHDVKIGMTNNSLFAYVADGHNGLRVIQLMSPEENANIYGFSPKPTPKLIATHEIHGGEALAVSEGIDRDRAVDESGNQLSVFNRRGARPFNLDEMRRMFLREGKLWTVTDDIPARPRRAPARADASGIIKWLDVTSPVTLPGVLLLMLMIGGVTVARRR